MLKVLVCACAILIASSLAAALEGWPEELKGDGLVVRFDPDPGQAKGLIIKGDQRFRFVAKAEGATLTGAFAAGDDRYSFSLAKQGNGYVLKSGQKSYALAATEPPVPIAPATGFIYSPGVIKDQKSTLDVATVLIPRGWQQAGGTVWRIDHAFFVSMNTAIFDPRTGWGLRLLPLDYLNCSPGLYQSAVQQNQSLLTIGGFELCGQIPSAKDYISQLVIPRYRSIEAARIAESEALQQLADAVGREQAVLNRSYIQAGYDFRYDAARVRIAFKGPGDRSFVEDVYCVLEVGCNPQANANVVQAGMPGAQTWMIKPILLYSLTAPEDEMAQAKPVLQTIFGSIRQTPQWQAFFMNIAQMMKQAALDDTMMVAAARAEISESQRRTIEENSNQAAKQSRMVGYLLRGTQPYADPNNPKGPPIEGPAGGNPHMSPQGDMQDVPPGATPPSDWKKMEPVDP